MAEIVNLNGRITPASEARVSVLDRSFLFGDGVYETLRTYGGRPFLLERHLDRLEYSAARLGIPLREPRQALAAEVERTLDAAGNPDSVLRIVLTRGEGLPEGDPALCRTQPNRMILVRPFQPPPESLYETGTAAAVVAIRRNDRRALDPRIKSNNLLNNLLASMEAHRHGVPEGILLNLEGDVAEGSSANVFLVDGEEILTPSLDTGILSGITREIVLEIARAEGLPAREERLPEARLREAQEIFLTSTTREILPVVRLDLRPVGDGHPGPVTRRLLGLFRAHVRAAAPVR